jgi:hypothetical protein
MRSFRRNLDLLQAMSHSAAELAEAIAKDPALASAQPQPLDTSAPWPSFEPNPEPAPPLPEATPEPVELPANPPPQPEAVSVTRAPSACPRKNGFVPEPTFARDPAQPEPLVNTTCPLPEPDGDRLELNMTNVA